MRPFKKMTAGIFAAAMTLSGAAGADTYYVTKNAGIPGHNRETHPGVSLAACHTLCTGRDWCRSVDYQRAKQECYLQPVNSRQVDLRTDYPGNPYDHYSRGFEAQCGARLAVVGLGAVALIRSIRQTRAERRARRKWSAFVGGASGASTVAAALGDTFTATDKAHPAFGLGTRYADLDKAKNVVMNCNDGANMRCTVTATPCAW